MGQTIIYDITIIGAGASGLMTAALTKKKSICIIEANPSLGAKIRVSGGGRCNVTNKHMSSKFFLGDDQFISHALGAYTQNDTLKFLRDGNVKTILQNKSRDGQYFLGSSSELIDLFKKSTAHTKIMLGTKVQSVSKNTHFEVITDEGTVVSKKLVVASGGISYPLLNASPIGYEIAKSFGHSIIEPKPALVGLTVQKEQFWMKELSGVSMPVAIKVEDKLINGDFLLTHRGCSGPAVLSASLYWSRGHLYIDFLPNISFASIIKDKAKQISTLLPLAKNFSKAFLASIGVEDKPVSKLSHKELQALEIIKNYPLAPAGTFGFSKAEVTKGGVDTSQIEAASMQSRLVSGLYFTGEVLDVTGELGGYNLQWAFSSAALCAAHLKSNPSAASI